MTGVLFKHLALFFYFLAAAGFIVFVTRQNHKAAAGGNYMMGTGFVLHSVWLIQRTAATGQLPVTDLVSAFGFFAWAVAGVYLIMWWRFKLPVLGAFASPLALMLALLGTVMPAGGGGVGPVYDSLGLNLLLTGHLGSVFAGYGFFGLAFVAGIMYLLQERQIRSKRMGAIYRRLPSLNVLDAINYYCLTAGFPLMTLGLITGALLAHTTMGAYWRWDPKETWSLILWMVYAALLHQRITVGWRGRRAAVMAIVGFAILCFTFIGVGLLMPGYHTFESLEQLRPL